MFFAGSLSVLLSAFSFFLRKKKGLYADEVYLMRQEQIVVKKKNIYIYIALD